MACFSGSVYWHQKLQFSINEVKEIDTDLISNHDNAK